MGVEETIFAGGLAVLSESRLKSELGGAKSCWLRGDITGVGGPLLLDKEVLDRVANGIAGAVGEID